jgi:LytS/YehU family sensor histidine kinase
MSAFQSFRQWCATSTLAHVAFGFLAMGAWAMFANRDHAMAAMLLAGFLQGAISGLITLGLKKFIEWLNARMRGAATLIVPPAITASSILVILVTAHALAGTPALWATIAAPWTVSTSYAILYNLRLAKKRRV